MTPKTSAILTTSSNFNVDNQLVEFVVAELNQMNAPITQKQAQHIVNILEYVSKSTSKSTIAAMTNALLELGVLKGD
ncbi:hypothetical protein [Streptococcus dysgalactiae]|uniref:hypothetical protein n=1 Tax=Streptococcus dysgalactiae TaxID=1334 RepID=UPI000E1C3B19|nr:hypothetical protein [Streptococcus dysgalactiae]